MFLVPQWAIKAIVDRWFAPRKPTIWRTPALPTDPVNGDIWIPPESNRMPQIIAETDDYIDIAMDEPKWVDLNGNPILDDDSYVLPERYERHKQDGWIGVDMDGTFAKFTQLVEIDEIGEPLMPMIERMRAWCKAGMDVRVMTARYSEKDQRCLKSDRLITPEYMQKVIGDYTEKHVGYRLRATCTKDYHMLELWDDRAIQMVPNTGLTLVDAHEAEMMALRGKGGV